MAAFTEELWSDVVRRKTGITLEDRGIRDEHGMEPLDNLFSSPAKSARKGASASRSQEDESDGEQEMEMDDEGRKRLWL
jgi:centromere protein C